MIVCCDCRCARIDTVAVCCDFWCKGLIGYRCAVTVGVQELIE